MQKKKGSKPPLKKQPGGGVSNSVSKSIAKRIMPRESKKPLPRPRLADIQLAPRRAATKASSNEIADFPEDVPKMRPTLRDRNLEDLSPVTAQGVDDIERMRRENIGKTYDAASVVGQAGGTGLQSYGGFIREEWHPHLRGNKGTRMYREMADNEPVIGATLYVIEMMLRQAKIRIEPKDDGPMYQECADFVQSCLDDILENGGWDGVMREILSCVVFGWSWLEKVYKYRGGPTNPVAEFRSKHNDGMIGWRTFAPRAQESLLHWNMTPQGEVLGMVQILPNSGETRTVPRCKSLHFRIRGTKGNPEGYSLLRPAYTSYYHKKHMQFVEALGIERYLAGMPVMNVPASMLSPTATADQQAALASYKDLVRKIRRDEQDGIVLPSETLADGKPSGFKFSLVGGGGNRPADVDPVIQRYDQRIAMSLLTQFLLLGSQGVGSFALSSSQTNLFSTGLGTILDMICEEFTNSAIPELCELNGFSAECAPVMTHGDVESPDLAALGQFVSSMVNAGALRPDETLEEYLREIASLPQAAPIPGRVAPRTEMDDITPESVISPLERMASLAQARAGAAVTSEQAGLPVGAVPA
jgi:hypothetical protein